jgi:3-oxoacyl-[acyl-carrier protein] reductase
LKLAEQGWAIAACYRKSEAAAASLRAELLARGTHILMVRADVSQASAARDLCFEVESECGRIDALINCIGSYHRVPLMEETLEGWHSAFDDNLHPVFYLSRSVAPGMMRRGWGRIVNFGMVNADQLAGQPFIAAHYIAKAGVLALTRSFAKALAPHGITVNSISPGFIDTGGVPGGVLSESFQTIPAGYLGKPDDVASAVLYLLSDEARYVNGANIQISGGWGV